MSAGDLTKEQDGEMNAKQSLEEASAGDLTKEQDGMLKVKQGQGIPSTSREFLRPPGGRIISSTS